MRGFHVLDGCLLLERQSVNDTNNGYHLFRFGLSRVTSIEITTILNNALPMRVKALELRMFLNRICTLMEIINFSKVDSMVKELQ